MIKFFVLSSILFVFIWWPVLIYASPLNLDQINQRVSDRFEDDTAKLAAIMEELRRRQGIQETRVAFGGIDTPIKSADYWITYAAEAIAYQRAQKYSSVSELRGSLEVLKNKVLKAKAEVGKALE